MLSSQSEAFGGELMLSNEEHLSDVRKMMEGWTDESLTLCARHNSPVFGTVHTDRAAMSKLNEVGALSPSTFSRSLVRRCL